MDFTADKTVQDFIWQTHSPIISDQEEIAKTYYAHMDLKQEVSPANYISEGPIVNKTADYFDLSTDCIALQENLERITAVIEVYVLPLFIIGVPTNILVFIIFSRGASWKASDALLFRMLAVFDATVVFINIGLHNIPMHFSKSIITYSDWTCKVLEYIYFVSRSMSGFTLAIIAVERALALSRPLNFDSICSRRNCLSFSITIFIIVCIMYFPLLISTKRGIFELSGEAICFLEAALPNYANGFFYGAEFVLSCILPIIIMLICDVIIIRALRRSKLIRSECQAGNSTDHIIPMLLIASIIFIILRLPHSIYIFLEVLFRAQPYSCTYKVAYFLGFIGHVCDCTNHSINMLLYCITGRKFRNAIKELFICESCREKTFSKNRSTDLSTSKSSRTWATSALSRWFGSLTGRSKLEATWI